MKIDNPDQSARDLVEALLQHELLVLSTPRSRREVEVALAVLLDHDDVTGETIAEELMDLSGVVDFFATDDDLDALLRGEPLEPRETADEPPEQPPVEPDEEPEPLPPLKPQVPPVTVLRRKPR